MKVKDYVCGSCAGGEIESLSVHTSAQDAMKFFCQSVLGLPNGPKQGYYRSKSQPRYNCTASHYVFIAGPEAIEDGDSYGYGWKNYGTSFAQYIIDQKLGLVATLPKIKNRKYHPDTSCQIWVWQPDQAALEVYWDEHNKELVAELNRKEAEMKARLAALHKLKVPTIKLTHRSAHPTKLGVMGVGDGTGGSNWTSSYVTFESKDRYGNLIHRTYGGSAHNTTPFDPKIVPEFGKEYIITSADDVYWNIAGVSELDEAAKKAGVK